MAWAGAEALRGDWAAAAGLSYEHRVTEGLAAIADGRATWSGDGLGLELLAGVRWRF